MKAREGVTQGGGGGGHWKGVEEDAESFSKSVSVSPHLPVFCPLILRIPQQCCFGKAPKSSTYFLINKLG